MTLPIESPEALDAAIAALSEADAVMAGLLRAGVRPTLRKREPGLPSLLSIVVSQQLSTASAAAIFGRLRSALPSLTAAEIARAPDETLVSAGLSRPKIRTVRAMAGAALDGSLRLGDLAGLPPDEAQAHLTAVPGIGPWTAQVYLLFCLGHPDIFPAGDLALQEAARLALDLPVRPDAKAMAALAERWRPWRGAAAYVLWAHYAAVLRLRQVPEPTRMDAGAKPTPPTISPPRRRSSRNRS